MRVWLVTGASRGLGRAFATAALDGGDAVVLGARDTQLVADLSGAYGDRALPVKLELTDTGTITGAVRGATETFGRLDVLVNNAGYALTGGIEEATEPEIRRQFEVNVFGAMWCTRHALPIMRRQRSGHIFQISSIGGVLARPITGFYNATKWALEGFSEALAAEVAPFGIRVTIIEPGPFRTDWWRHNMVRAAPMDAYDAVLADRRRYFAADNAAVEADDPRQAARALLDVLSSDRPPLRLLLGSMAADAAPSALRARLDEWAQWEHLSRRAEVPD